MFFDRLVRFLLPRQDHFFTLLEGIGGQMTAAAAVFAELATASDHEQFDPSPAASSRSRPRPTTSATASTRNSTGPSSRPSTARTWPR